MIKIIVVRNYLDPSENRSVHDIECVAGKTYAEYIKELEVELAPNVFVTSSKNGKITNFDTFPDIDDEIVVKYMPGLVAGTWAAIGIFLLKAVVIAVIGTAISYGINALIGKKKPSFGSTGGNDIDDGSPTYGWNGIATSQNVGTPVPVIYGRHMVGGNIINQYVKTDGDSNYLNVLLALGEGEIKSITDLRINDNPAGNYDDVTTTTRLGTNLQTVIPNFEDAHNVYSVNVDLIELDASYIYTTLDSDVESFVVSLNFSGGLFEGKDNGDVVEWSVSFQLEYKLNSSPTWIDLGETTITERKRTAFTRTLSYAILTPGKYDIRVTRTSEESSLDPLKQGDVTWQSLDEIKPDDFAYPNTALLAVEALAADQLNGSTPNLTAIVEGKLIQSPIVYDLSSDVVAYEDYYWDPVADSYRLFSDDSLCTISGTADQWSANPVWCMRDILTNTAYGLGTYIESDNLDEASYLDAAKYCDERVDDGEGGFEKRYRLDMVLDSAASALDVITSVSAAFNGMPFYSDGKLKFTIDKPADPVQLFTMGNILKDSFTQQWKPYTEIYNIINVDFVNLEKNYQRDVVTISDAESIEAGEPLREKTVRVYTTKQSYALRIGRYAMRLNKLIKRSVSLKCGMDACAVTAGDVFSVQHDVPLWGEGGRVVSATTDAGNHIITLDRDVTISGASAFKLLIRDNTDDTLETKDVIEPAGLPVTTGAVKVDGLFAFTPAQGDIFTFGTATTIKKDFRAIEIGYDEETNIELRGIEYNPEVYDDVIITGYIDTTTQINFTIPTVENLELSQRTVENGDGTTKFALDAYWNIPTLSGTSLSKAYSNGKIYFSLDDAYYRNIGQTEGNSFSILDETLISGSTYYVKVATITKDNNEQSLSLAASDSIIISGGGGSGPVVGIPPAPTGFSYDWIDELRLYWDIATDARVAGYEIRTQNVDWGVDSATFVWKGDATEYKLNPLSRTPGTYYLRTYNSALNYSTTSVSVVPTDAAPGAVTLTSNVFFNVGRLEWDGDSDSNLIGYAIYQSETGAWGGEEDKIGDTIGSSFVIKGSQPFQGVADSATTTTVTDATLAGKGVDYFVGDKVLITSGDAESDERTITAYNNTTGAITVSSAWSDTIAADDNYIIFDVKHYKVAGYDLHGEGTLSNSESVEFEVITSDMLGDDIILARKIFVDQLSAITANLGTVTAGVIIGLMIKSATSGSRVEFDNQYFKAYNDSEDVVFQITMTGTDEGDIIIGDYAGGAGCKWDDSEGLFSVAGDINASSGTFTGNVNVGSAGNVRMDGENDVIEVFADVVSIGAGINDDLDWSENGTTKVNTLTPGDNYTPITLADHIQTQMLAVGDSNTTVTYNASTKKITIANSSLTSLSLLWNSGDSATTNCAQLLGFSPEADDTGALTYTADYQVALRVQMGKLS